MGSNTSITYADWALDCFRQRLTPFLAALRADPLPGVDTSVWLDVCEPGETESTRHRLFPGSLFLLWVEALGGPGASAGAEPLAVAIELLHNASLVHDDVLDGHDVRKGQPTLLHRFGLAGAVMGGDGLFAACLSALSQLPSGRLAGCLKRLGQAAEDVVAGQLMDEPDRWAQVPPGRHEDHWLAVCRGKLALGNVPGPLAAYWTGREELEGPLRECLRDYAVVSQIINDFGDLLGFAGYHVLAPSLRQFGEESARKPTLPRIWMGADAPRGGPPPPELLGRARAEIERRRTRVLRSIGRLPLSPAVQEPLLDFFRSPRLPA